MYALIAAVVALAVVAMMWRLLDKEVARRDADPDGEATPSRRPTLPRRSAPTRTIAPDDDPEFLRELSKRIARPRDDEQTA